MACRYCGRPVSPAQRFRSGGDFCSLQHRLSYGEILDRLNRGESPATAGLLEQHGPVASFRKNIGYGPELWRSWSHGPRPISLPFTTDPPEWLEANGANRFASREPGFSISGYALEATEHEGFRQLSSNASGREQDDSAAESSCEEPAREQPPEFHPKVVRMIPPNRSASKRSTRAEQGDRGVFEIPLARTRSRGGFGASPETPASGPLMPAKMRTSGDELLELGVAEDSPDSSLDPFASDQEQEAEWQLSAPLPSAWPIDLVSDRGYYPYAFPERLIPVDVRPAGFSLKSSSEQRPAKNFWWKQPGGAKASRSKSRANSSIIPKGFTGFQPMSTSQPSFRTLRLRTGDYAMADTASQERAAAILPPESKMSNSHRNAVQQIAWKLSQQRWQSFQFPLEPVEMLDYPLRVEFAESTKLRYEVSGFDFSNDPDPPRNGFRRLAEEPPLASVAELLAEPETPLPGEPARPEPLVWDELEPGSEPAENGIPALAAALELYEPPGAFQKSSKSNESARREDRSSVGLASAEVRQQDELPPPAFGDMVKFPVPNLREAKTGEVPRLEPASAVSTRLHLPALSLQPLRAPMLIGPPPTGPAEIESTKSEPVPAGREALQTEGKPADQAADAALRKKSRAEAKLSQLNLERATAPQETDRQKREVAEDPIEEPTALSEELEDALAQAAEKENQKGEAAGAGQNAPTIGAKVEQPAAVEAGPMAPPVPPQTVSIPSGVTLPAGSVLTEASPSSSGLKIGAIAAVLAVFGGLGAWFFLSSPKPSSNPPATPSASRSAEAEVAGVILGEAGWTQEWALDAKGTRLRQIAFFQPSMTVIDYRVEFLAEIESKAVSWVARAANAKNYYLAKLVQVRGGVQPEVHFVRFAVRDGKADPPSEKPLPFAVRLGDIFKVRMDVLADRFTVTVQDKLVDEWVESKLLTGGFGVANEASERGQIRSIQMWRLKPKSKK
ncbi:MAG: hypothetical protein NZV14_04940 [Bryobacteraceae bacterium]|nr:hypothetical protein [Bryobacteraceae bacterium]MDW8377481.1 hypothetical protein [Bryobacterales bacterium]